MKKLLAAAPLLGLLSSGAAAETTEELAEQVRKTEIAFAKTMADRDHAAFVSFHADEAVFFGRGGIARRGKAQVGEDWRRYFEGREAPFSWAPESVEVLDSGGLGFSSGPVRSPSGQQIGTFNSVWRREKDGKWRIVFDKGCPPCETAAAE